MAHQTTMGWVFGVSGVRRFGQVVALLPPHLQITSSNPLHRRTCGAWPREWLWSCGATTLGGRFPPRRMNHSCKTPTPGTRRPTTWAH